MNPWIMILLAVVLGVGLLVFLRKSKSSADNKGAASAKEKAKPGKAKKDKAARAVKQQAAEEAVSDESAEQQKTEPDPEFALKEVGWEGGQVAEVSVTEVDDLTEYEVYKQFGYFDKAAASLAGYLSRQDNKPKERVLELCGLYLECGDIDNFVLALDDYHGVFEREELVEMVKLGFELEPGNLSLRVFAESQLGWTAEDVAKYVVVKDAAIHKPEAREEAEDTVESSFREAGGRTQGRRAYFRKLANAKPLVQGYRPVSSVSEEERDVIVAFSSEEKVTRLLGREIPYIHAVNLYNRAFNRARRPASLIIDALNLDFQNRNIDNYARHLWELYSTLGGYGRLVKEKMLAWGYSLGAHPIFMRLESAPNDITLREVGVEYGYASDNISNIKAKMLPLVVENTEVGEVRSVGEIEEILAEAESALMYGQLEEAMTILENGVYAHIQEPQLYADLLDLYERSESWDRFGAFSVKVRSSGVDLPDEIIVALSRLSQKMEERG